jgi:hypothetical protein
MKLALILLFMAATAAAHPPVSVVVDGQGNAYYSDLKQVWKVAPDGTKNVVVSGVHTHELYLDPRGNLYGEHLWYEGERTDKWGHYVWRRSPDGKVVKVIPNTEGFLTNYSFVRDAGGNMYLAVRDKKRVERLAPNGTRAVVVSNLDNIRWMMATPDGALYVVNNTDLVRVTTAGAAKGLAKKVAETSIFRMQFGPNHAVMGLWTDRAGNVYAAAASEGKVKKIAPDGKVSVVLKSKGGWTPTGGAFAPNGDLLLLEWSMTNAARLRRIPAANLGQTPRSAATPARRR